MLQTLFEMELLAVFACVMRPPLDTGHMQF